jgi:hypothetical protein
MKRLLIIAAIFVLGATGAIFAIGWALAARVPEHVGNSPADLGGEMFHFRANQERLFIVGGVQRSIVAGLFCCCQESVQTGWKWWVARAFCDAPLLGLIN